MERGEEQGKAGAAKVESQHDETADLEASLARRGRTVRLVLLGIIALVLVAGTLAGLSYLKSKPQELSPLEKVFDQPFVELQLAWYAATSTSAQFNISIQQERAQALDQAITTFLTGLKEADEELVSPMAAVLDRLKKLTQSDVLLEEGNEELSKSLAAVNELLATRSPRLYLDGEPFSGFLQNEYITSLMIMVYQVLGVERIHVKDSERIVELKIVRRVDTLPGTPSRRGYVRVGDTTSAFVLRENATTYITDRLLPAIKSPETSFRDSFEDLPDSLIPPYKAMMELVKIEVRGGLSTDDATFNELMDLLMERSRILGTVLRSAERFSVRLPRPDGLVWPRGFLGQVFEENAKLLKKGDNLVTQNALDRLAEIQAILEDGKHAPVIEQFGDIAVGSIAVHEARHVLDLEDGREAGDCIRQRVALASRDLDFWTEIDLEARSYLTQLIESPTTSRMTQITLFHHLFQRDGTVAFYAARTILHSLAYEEGEKDIPRGFAYLEELLMRVAALGPEEVAQKATELYDTCFDGYQGLERMAPEKVVEQSSGCSVSRMW